MAAMWPSATLAGLHDTLCLPWTWLRRQVARQTLRWARQRQGADASQITLQSRRIYILPTGAGLLYAIMLLVMLVAAMNYNNNLGFALTFVLAALGIVSIHHTHRNLAGLHLGHLGAAPVFAGTALAVRFALDNDDRRPREELSLQWSEGTAVTTTVPPSTRRVIIVPLATTKRGLMDLPPLRISSRAPLGLTRAWAWVHFPERALVYPRPADHAAVPAAASPVSADTCANRGDGDDFAGLRAWQNADSLRHIAWKHYARSDELLVRQFDGGDRQILWFDWDRMQAAAVETRVSLLARLVIDACAAGHVWGLALPGTRLGPATGDEHLRHCLRCLATAALPARDA